jgi:hypothetical protein
VYPLSPSGEVFDFINAVRRDWNSNFTLLGPFQFFDFKSPLLQDKSQLKKILERKNLKLIALAPFLDYDPGSMDHVIPRDEFKVLAQRAAAALREASPGIKVLGCIETDWVTIYPEKMKDGHLIVAHDSRQIPRVVDQADLPWKDSIKRGKDGSVAIEFYRRGGKPQYALAVYPAPGNYQHKFLLEQAEFLMDEVGLDGFYIDEFSQAWRDIRSYEGWDGVTVDIDPATGRIIGKFINCGLVGTGPRVDIIQSALARNKIIVANTYATAAAEQALGAQRFAETQGFVLGAVSRPGEKPGLVPQIFEGVLAAPIGLGAVPSDRFPHTAKSVVLATIAYLRHGAVIYHYSYPDIPETGAGSGEYGPINHMYPITPVRLFEGGIVGEERTVTCVSGTYEWKHARRPKVLTFDLTGREKPSDFSLKRRWRRWRVELRLKDWAEIAVIE